MKYRLLLVEDVPSDAELALKELNKVFDIESYKIVEKEADYLESLEKFRLA